MEKKKHPVLPQIKSVAQTSEGNAKVENPEICELDQMLYGDINPAVKLEDVLIPLKEAKAANAEKEPEASKKASGGDTEMKAVE